MAIATYDDANLLLRLYEMRREPVMRDARAWFAKNAKFASFEEFTQKCPPGSQENAYFRQVTTYQEMVASFLTSGVLNSELFFQSGRELLMVWVRIRGIVPALRESFQDPTAYRNLEHVAKMYVEWMNQQGPNVFEAFAKRIG